MLRTYSVLEAHRSKKVKKLIHLPGTQGFPCQSVKVMPGDGGSSPSHQTPPSLVSPTFVNIVFLEIVSMACGFVLCEVPGATPKNPFSGLMALSLPKKKVDKLVLLRSARFNIICIKNTNSKY